MIGKAVVVLLLVGHVSADFMCVDGTTAATCTNNACYTHTADDGTVTRGCGDKDECTTATTVEHV